MSKCNACGLCCRLFLINLSRKEYESGEYLIMVGEEIGLKNFKKVRECGANLLAQNDDGSCVYLVDNKCSIHKRRPAVCRGFFCESKMKKYEGMVAEIKKADVDMTSVVSKECFEKKGR